jgi:putative DNA primase/helicase
MTAESIARLLSGRRVGSAWMAKCPAHDDREPSLSIREADNGKVLVRCHAGCEQVQLIAVLKARGIWSETARRHYSTIDSNSVVTNRPNRGDAKRTQAALHMWEATLPANGTLVETYLSSRNIIIPAPPALRFHAGLKHPSGGIWPAMVALVTNGADATPIAVHRTFLARDGRRKAPVEPTKMMLGPCRGGAVRLGAIGDQLMIL